MLSKVNASKAASLFADKFLAIMEQCIPYCNLKRDVTYHGYQNTPSNLFNSLFRKASRSQNEIDMSRYRKLRNRIVKPMRDS